MTDVYGRPNDEIGIALLDALGVVHWAPWYSETAKDRDANVAEMRRGALPMYAWALCWPHQGKRWESIASVDPHDVTCLGCLARLGGCMPTESDYR